MKCKHARKNQIGPDYGFAHAVAVHPYTAENPAAHGGVTFTEQCETCGAQRAVNQNQRHIEVGPFGPSCGERAEAVQRELELAIENMPAVERAALDSRNADLIEISAGRAHVRIDARLVWISVDDIAAAAAQLDTGDGLVPFYSGIGKLVAAELARKEKTLIDWPELRT